jgi:hypothetical protein
MQYEILIWGIVCEHLATALETNSKIIMIGGNNQGQGGSGNLLNMIPMYTMLTESGLLSLLPEEMTPTPASKKTKKEE